MSLSSSLLMSVQAMQTEQGALSVVSNNIANVNTPGYTREVADIVETTPVRFGNLEFGTGVALNDVRSVRDNVLQLRLNQETQNQSKLNTLTNGLNQLQSLFNEPAGSGLQSLLTGFFGSFQQLSSDPTNLVLRQNVISAAHPSNTIL